MWGCFLKKAPPRPLKNFSGLFLLCDGVLRISRRRCSRLPSGTAKTLPALAMRRDLCGGLLQKSPTPPKTFPTNFYCVMECFSSQDQGAPDCRQAPPRPCRRSRGGAVSENTIIAGGFLGKKPPAIVKTDRLFYCFFTVTPLIPKASHDSSMLCSSSVKNASLRMK